jgi:hypothetical protein
MGKRKMRYTHGASQWENCNKLVHKKNLSAPLAMLQSRKAFCFSCSLYNKQMELSKNMHLQ